LLDSLLQENFVVNEMLDFGPTKTVLLTVMSLPHSCSTYLEDIAKSVDHDLIARDSEVDVGSPQPVYRKSDGLFDAGKSSKKMKRQNDSRIKRNLMYSDENLKEENDEQHDETKNMDFASKIGILTI